MIRTGLFRLVAHHEAYAYMGRGRMIVRELGAVHGCWTVLMWHCECGEVAP